MAREFKGDIGAFRNALKMAGFRKDHSHVIFNDNSKAKINTGIRRLKLWYADDVFSESQKKQRELERYLRQAFGDRILAMYFIAAAAWCGGGKSLCIRLRDKV